LAKLKRAVLNGAEKNDGLEGPVRRCVIRVYCVGVEWLATPHGQTQADCRRLATNNRLNPPTASTPRLDGSGTTDELK
jgi:hypothetical protein